MRVIRLQVLALVVAGALLAVGCSATSDVNAGPTTTRAATKSGQAATAKLKDIIASMVASNDPCTILTQKDVPKNQLDPSLLTSSSARKVLYDGLVQIFDHLIAIGPAQLQGAFSAEKTTFSEVLTVVDQYAKDPQNSQATEQISTLIQSPGYLAAQSQITSWVSTNCG